METTFPLEVWHRIAQFAVGVYNYSEPVRTVLDEFRQVSHQSAHVVRDTLKFARRLNLRIWWEQSDTVASFNAIQTTATALVIPFFVPFNPPPNHSTVPIKLRNLLMAHPGQLRQKLIRLVGVIDPGYNNPADYLTLINLRQLNVLASDWRVMIATLDSSPTLETVEFGFNTQLRESQDVTDNPTIFIKEGYDFEFLGAAINLLISVARYPKLRAIRVLNLIQAEQQVEPMVDTLPVHFTDFDNTTPATDQVVVVNFGEMLHAAIELIRQSPAWVQIHIDNMFLTPDSTLMDIPDKRVEMIDSVQITLYPRDPVNFATEIDYLQGEDTSDSDLQFTLTEIQRICQHDPLRFTILSSPGIRPRRLLRAKAWIMDVFPNAKVVFGMPAMDRRRMMNLLDFVHRVSGKYVPFTEIQQP